MKHTVSTFICLILITFLGCSEKSNEETSRYLGESSTISSSGIEYLFANNGDGPKVEAGQEISTHCVLKVGDTSEVWSTRATNEPFNFIYKEDPMIPGFEEMLSMMKEGDRVKVIIPSELGYGQRGAGADIPPGATLSFDIEILSVSQPRRLVSEILFDQIVNNGFEEAITFYNDSIKANPTVYDFSERQMYILSQRLLSDGRINNQIDILELTTQEYPESSGAYYRLAKAYSDQGSKKKALASVEKALELNPENQAALALKDEL